MLTMLDLLQIYLYMYTAHSKLAADLSISADFDWFVVVPRILEVHTHRKLQATPAKGIKDRGVDAGVWIGMGFYVEYIIKIWMLFTKHPITFGHNDDLQTMKHLVDSTACLLTISANRMSISLLHCARNEVKDAVLNFYNSDFCLKSQMYLHIPPW